MERGPDKQNGEDDVSLYAAKMAVGSLLAIFATGEVIENGWKGVAFVAGTVGTAGVASVGWKKLHARLDNRGNS